MQKSSKRKLLVFKSWLFGPIVMEVVWFSGLDAADSWTSRLVAAGSGLASWTGYYRLWVKVLFLDMAWPLSMCIFSLSSHNSLVG